MSRIKVLFWNVDHKKTPFETVINDISKDIDILVLAEAENINDLEIESAGKLNRVTLMNPAVDQDDLTPRVYSSGRGFKLSHLNTVLSKRLIAYTLKLRGLDPVIFCAIHFPSKLEYNSSTQEALASTYISWINELEEVRKTKRTIVCGDFNMNPFELGMIQPTGFNATMSKDIVKTDKKRTFHYQKYDYFYNPMWNFMGDHINGSPKLPGSYHFYTTTNVEITYWNVFDKVIARPELVDHLDLASVNILQNKNGHTFIDSAFKIDRVKYSDHLPLTFDLIF